MIWLPPGLPVGRPRPRPEQSTSGQIMHPALHGLAKCARKGHRPLRRDGSCSRCGTVPPETFTPTVKQIA